jgi:hypothetical protein
MFKRILRVGLCCLLPSLLATISACAAQPAWDGVGDLYNFGWTMGGNATIAPVQVFDDGSHVYLQFPEGRQLPAILADAPGGEILLTPQKQFPYVVINHFETQLEFRLGPLRAYARRSLPQGGAPQGVATGHADPAVVTGAAPMPVSRTAMIEDRQRADAAFPATSAGAVVAAPVAIQTAAWDPPAQASPYPSATPADALPHYVLALSDGTVGQAFTRWSLGSGWVVRWDATPIARITGDSQVDGPLLNAVITVVDALKQAGYPVDEQWDLPHQMVTIRDTTTAAAPSVPHRKTHNRTSRRKA